MPLHTVLDYFSEEFQMGMGAIFNPNNCIVDFVGVFLV